MEIRRQIERQKKRLEEVETKITSQRILHLHERAALEEEADILRDSICGLEELIATKGHEAEE